MNINWFKTYITYFCIISTLNLISYLMNSKFTNALGVVLWVLVIIFSFKRKEYKSLNFLWILKLLFTGYFFYNLFTHPLTNLTLGFYIYAFLMLVDLVLLKFAINYSKKSDF